MDAASRDAGRRDTRRRLLLALAVLVASLAGLGASWLLYQRYAEVHRRPIAPLPRCVLLARRLLAKQADVSGSEPFPTPDGEVYLTPEQNRAVHCLEGISKPAAIRLAHAFTEQEPEIRGLELLKIVREIPPDPAFDREATAAYFLVSTAMRALPELPETKAANDELTTLHGCRFYVKRLECATRPPIPMSVWLTGVPSAAGALFGLFVLGGEGARRALAWRRARKAKAKAEAERARTADEGNEADQAKEADATDETDETDETENKKPDAG